MIAQERFQRLERLRGYHRQKVEGDLARVRLELDRLRALAAEQSETYRGRLEHFTAGEPQDAAQWTASVTFLGALLEQLRKTEASAIAMERRRLSLMAQLVAARVEEEKMGLLARQAALDQQGRDEQEESRRLDEVGQRRGRRSW